jgi:hypothetical protein
MRKAIWKFPLTPHNETVMMPTGAEILSAHAQGGCFCVWALVDPTQPMERRIIETFPTGEAIPCDIGIERKFIGTAMLAGGALVFHVFERIN